MRKCFRGENMLRLKDLREDKDLYQQDIAKILKTAKL